MTQNGTTKNSGVKNDVSLFAPELEWLASLSQQEFSADVSRQRREAREVARPGAQRLRRAR